MIMLFIWSLKIASNQFFNFDHHVVILKPGNYLGVSGPTEEVRMASGGGQDCRYVGARNPVDGKDGSRSFSLEPGVVENMQMHCSGHVIGIHP